MESAVNTIPPSEETVAKLQPLASGATPLALEIAVNVAGARPTSASGQRDLFSEDTATVLISEKRIRPGPSRPPNKSYTGLAEN